MRAKRLDDMQDYIVKNKTVSIDTLCEVFGVSRNTVRRDIDALAAGGTIRKTYGGVISTPAMETVPIEERAVKNMALKRRIAEMAGRFVNPGDTIFIDTGSTASCFYSLLPKDIPLTVFTNNLEILLRSVKDNEYNVISTGGQLSRKTNSVVGEDAVRTIERYNIGKAFLSATGITLQHGATNSSQGEYQVKKAAVTASSQVYLMVDSTKFGVVSLLTFCDLADVTALVTDAPPDEDYIAYLKANNVQLVSE